MSDDLPARLRKANGLDLELKREAADEILILRSKLSLRENLEQGLMDGVARLQDEVRRLEEVISASQPTLTDDERHCLTQAMAINTQKCFDPLRGLLKRMT